jgi:transposase-like protein
VEHVSGLRGPAESKLRLRVILETLSGERTVAEACAELEISEARFHQLRQQALEGALKGLSPGKAGRPRKEEPVVPGQVEELEQEVRDLEVDLQAARVRTELALAMPHLLKKEPQYVSKKGKQLAKVKRRNRKDADG